MGKPHLICHFFSVCRTVVDLIEFLAELLSIAVILKWKGPSLEFYEILYVLISFNRNKTWDRCFLRICVL